MCGRITLKTSPRGVAAAFGLGDLPLFEPRYNIAPTQPVAAIQWVEGRRQLSFLRWGLIPSWADDPSIGNRMINARAEGLADKPSFRAAFRRGRCLIVADGFYEWKKIGKSKQPYLLRMKSGEPFALAGLAEHWRRGEQAINSCTIITTTPNRLAAEIHNRMPVILDAGDYDAWLNPASDPAAALELLRPCPADTMESLPVSGRVNDPRNEGPDCLAPTSGP